MKQKSFLALLALLISLSSCAKKPPVVLPQYAEFVTTRQQDVPDAILEIYGQYTAKVTGKRGGSQFNLLLHPGKHAYLEVLDTAKQLVYVLSVNPETVTLLWAKDGNYIKEPATPQTLNAIAAVPLMPDDLLLIIGGFGLNFKEWQMMKRTSDGWLLQRDSFSTNLELEEKVSLMKIESSMSAPLFVRYGNYKSFGELTLPGNIDFEIPKRQVALSLRIEKCVARDEPISADLFDIKLPADARKLSLEEIYRNKPLIFEH